MAIGGGRVDACSGRTFSSSDPFTGEAWATFPDAAGEDVDRAVTSARDALGGPWGDLTGFERARLMRRLAALLERDAERLARIETRDSGMLLRHVAIALAYLPEWLYFYSGLADKLEGSTIPGDKPNFLVYTRHEPVGVVAAIVPWNSPLQLLCWKLAPALAAGCTFIAKPSELTPATAIELADLIDEAGFPPGVFNVVTGAGSATGKALTAHRGVDKLAFTGSTATGIEVARSAGNNLTRVSLELGGKSPHVVFADADLEAAANGVALGVFAHSGQLCLAGSRIIVHRSVHDALVQRVAAHAKTIRLGDPADDDTDVGPLANQTQRDRVMAYLESARGDGAVIAAGGEQMRDLPGFFVQPTVLTGVSPDMAVAREEVFGPVVATFVFDSEQEAIDLANDTEYGLAAAVWTKDVHRAHRVAHRIKAGTVWVNSYRVVSPSAPFGGMRASGIGRENGLEAIAAYTETKTVWVETSGETRDPFPKS